jgi:hypothetical protein
MNELQVFLIIGAQKSGTTALFSYLIQHPQIKGAKSKEVHFFNSATRYDLGRNFYRSQFEQGAFNTFYLDASPSYLVNPDACARIFEYNPKIKMIAILRNPIDRAFSAWNMYRTRYRSNREWFFTDWLSLIGGDPNVFIRRSPQETEDFTRYIINEINNQQIYPQKSIEAPVLMHGLYAKQINRFLKLFSEDQLLLVEAVDLQKNPQRTLKKIEGFLGIDAWSWDHADLKPVFEGTYFSEMSPEARALLTEYYRPHNEQLFETIGRRFNWK